MVILPSSAIGCSLSPLRVPSVSVTSPIDSARRRAEPWKMTSSIVSPRMCEARFSPRTQMRASQMFDLPQPFGPTTAVIGGGEGELGGVVERLEAVNVELFETEHFFLSCVDRRGS